MRPSIALAPLRMSLSALWSDFLRLFSNILFAVSLFAVWGFLTLIGVIVDQGKDPGAYWAEYSPPIARLILRLHLDNIYHGAAYVGIIGLILVSLTVCTFKRVIPARLPRLHPVKIDKIPLNATIELREDAASVRARVEGFLHERGWSIRKREFGGAQWSFGDRHNWARRGVLVAHVGFVIIAAGTTLYWATGFSGETSILTGETATIARSGARIHLDSFAYKFDPVTTKSGLVYQPIDYVSRVHVTGHDGVTREKTIRVNQPIDVDGTLYYQSSYGNAATLTLTQWGKPVAGTPNEPLKEGLGFAIPGTSRSIQYQQFVGTIDRKTQGIARDPRANDPGVVLAFYDGDALLGRTLVPIGEAVDLGGGYSVTPAHYTLYSGLQYRFDPGIPLVGIGAFVLLAGLCIAFYLLPARLFILVEPTERGASLGIAATTVKGYDIFEDEFAKLVAELESEVGAAQAAPQMELGHAT